jgi:hypothetical protein
LAASKTGDWGSFTDIDESSLSFAVLLGTAKNGAQDLCNKTYTIEGAP